MSQHRAGEDVKKTAPQDTQTRSRLLIGQNGPSDSALAASSGWRLLAAQPLTGTRRAALLGACARACVPRRYTPSLETQEPPRAGFATVGALIAPQPPPPVPDGGAERKGLTVDQIQPRGGGRRPTGDGQQPPDVGPQGMQSGNPLLVSRQGRKGTPPIAGHQAIGLLQSSDLKHPLEQGNRQDLGTAEVGLRMGRATPAGQRGVSFPECVDKAVDLGHVVVYAAGHRSSSSEENQRSRFDSTPPSWIDDLAVSTQD